jgi:hypothetical protein
VSAWGHWENPVIYMSRATTRELWRQMYGIEPDLRPASDLRFGQSRIPVLFDDRMEFGVARLEEDPAADADASEPVGRQGE